MNVLYAAFLFWPSIYRIDRNDNMYSEKQLKDILIQSYFYYSANEEWQSRDILFTIAEYIVQWYP